MQAIYRDEKAHIGKTPTDNDPTDGAASQREEETGNGRPQLHL
jgi:hypothetical protein